MKKIILIMLIFLFLTGCNNKTNILDNKNDGNNITSGGQISDVNNNDNNSNNNGNTIKDEDINNNNNSNNANSQNNNSNSSNNAVNNGNNQSNNEGDNNTLKPDTSVDSNKEDNQNNNQQTGSNSVNDNNQTNDITYSNNDKIVISTIETLDKDVDSLLKEGKSEDTLDKAKGVFITLVDFVFYDGEIKGITFSELTENGKAKVLALINTIDEKIENRFPGYKEKISDKAGNAFNKASELIKKGANNIKEFAREKLGDKYYQDIIDTKDEFVKYTKNAFSILKDFSSNLFSSLKDKLSEWYQNFKNKN